MKIKALTTLSIFLVVNTIMPFRASRSPAEKEISTQVDIRLRAKRELLSLYLNTPLNDLDTKTKKYLQMVSQSPVQAPDQYAFNNPNTRASDIQILTKNYNKATKLFEQLWQLRDELTQKENIILANFSQKSYLLNQDIRNIAQQIGVIHGIPLSTSDTMPQAPTSAQADSAALEIAMENAAKDAFESGKSPESTRLYYLYKGIIKTAETKIQELMSPSTIGTYGATTSLAFTTT